MSKEAGVNIPDAVIDRAHRTVNINTDNKSRKSCKSSIMSFTTFYYKTVVHPAKKNMKDNLR